ncbi:MAG: leucine-rich repeat domain-containing protein [Promethearchaeota archaeon]
MPQFEVNDYITLKLEEGENNIYLGGELFRQCKYILLEVPCGSDASQLDDINSIDDAAELLDHSTEEGSSDRVSIPPEVEFWAHCSNLQAWAEHGYDTRLLHSNLAFPLLKKLAKMGDPVAGRMFKEEVAKRFLSGSESVQRFLVCEGCLKHFTWDEKAAFFKHGAREIMELEALIKEKIKIVFRIENHYPSIQLVNGDVIALRVSGKGLKQLPEQIKRLKSLKKLIVSGLSLDTLPDWIGECESIETLDLHYNRLKRLPESIGRMKNLDYLDLSYNELESLQDSIGELKWLCELDIANNRLRSLPESIGKLKYLRKLYINENLFEEVPDAVRLLASLETISLSGNPISKLPDYIFSLPSLETIGIKDTEIKLTQSFKKRIEFTNSLKKKIGEKSLEVIS